MANAMQVCRRTDPNLGKISKSHEDKVFVSGDNKLEQTMLIREKILDSKFGRGQQEELLPRLF